MFRATWAAVVVGSACADQTWAGTCPATGQCDDVGTKDGANCCQVTDDAFTCCEEGFCIPNVGCRCRAGEFCSIPEKVEVKSGPNDGVCPSSGTCADGTPCCQVDADTFDCCDHGFCIPNVGCRCRELEQVKVEVKDDTWAGTCPISGTCDDVGTKDGANCCQVTDDAFTCCEEGFCIPNVGCRCRAGEFCSTPVKVEVQTGSDGVCPSSGLCDDKTPCCQVSDTTFECCNEGSCIPHVGCRCREGEFCGLNV